MPILTHLEMQFSNAVVDAGVPPPSQVRGKARFVVYRNNVAMGLYAALSSRYPVVKRLVGDDFFREMCRLYVEAEPPRSPILLYYGETFPTFIEEFAPAHAIPYLGAVARIELARGLAYHAADVDVLDAKTFGRLDPARIPELRFELHPSVSVITSDYPIYAIWKVNQSKAPVIPVSPWIPEGVLVTRPQYMVQVYKLAPGQAAFIRSLADGRSVAEAADAGFEDAPSFDPTVAFGLLISAKIVTALDPARVVRSVVRH